MLPSGAGGLTSSQLLPLRGLPHTAAYIDDEQRLETELEAIRLELEGPRAEFDRARREQTVPDELAMLAAFPALVLVLDDFDQLRSQLDDAIRGTIENLIKRGRGLGFHVMVASNSTEIASAWEAPTKGIKDAQVGFVLGSTDIADISVLGARLPHEELGRAMVPGRGYFIRRGRIRALQVANALMEPPSLGEWVEQIRQKT